MSRTGKTAINSIIGLLFSLLSSVISFVLQALFIRLLGLEYSGINSLFTGVMSILNIADLGVNNAILFRLYKLIGENDNDEIERYLLLYKRICYAIASIVGVLGIVCIPFLGGLINRQPSFSESLWSLFIIVLLTSVVTHANNYRGILIIAKQDRYIKTVINYGCSFLAQALQIGVLLWVKSIHLYLSVKLFTGILNGIISGIVTQNRYGIKWKSNSKLNKDELFSILKDVGYLAVYKICRTIDAYIDTFLISKLIDIAVTAIYASVSMILNALTELLNVFADGMIASVGDLNATGDRQRLEDVFYQTTHFTYLLYGISTATLVPFLSSFVNWWIGYTLDDICIYLMLVNFFTDGLAMNIATYRNSMGIFSRGYIRPAVTAFLNVIFSISLTVKFGLIGTLIGTFLARLFTTEWYDPYLVLKYGMGRSPFKYYFRYILYTTFTIISAFILLFIKKYLSEPTSFIHLLYHGVVYMICSSITIIGFGFLFKEQISIIRRILSLFKSKYRN
jgi:O-antigen/teichoic acid export membrane protein